MENFGYFEKKNSENVKKKVEKSRGKMYDTSENNMGNFK